MVKNQSTMFNKVNSFEKRVIFRSLATRKSKLMMKSIEEVITQLVATKNVEDKKMECKLVQMVSTKEGDEDSGKIIPLRSNQSVILNFNFNEDRYFMQTNMIVNEERILLDLEPDLFVLQRRKSPRIELPTGFPQHLRIIEYQGKVVFFEGRVLDFGPGGCRVEMILNTPRFATADRMALVLRLSHRNPLNLKAEVRHIVLKEDERGLRQTFGVQFKDLGSIMENKMMSLLMELQKEMFTKNYT